MSLIKRMRKQQAVWWSRNPTPDQSGNHTFAAPVEIKCRWEDIVKQFRDSQGEMQLSSALVYVDREMELGDRLMKGEMPTDVEADPMEEPLAFEIKRFEKLPNLRNKETLLTAYL